MENNTKYSYPYKMHFKKINSKGLSISHDKFSRTVDEHQRLTLQLCIQPTPLFPQGPRTQGKSTIQIELDNDLY